jgi:hypothetical protein
MEFDDERRVFLVGGSFCSEASADFCDGLDEAL